MTTSFKTRGNERMKVWAFRTERKRLKPADWDVLYGALTNPPKANKMLIAAVRRYDNVKS